MTGDLAVRIKGGGPFKEGLNANFSPGVNVIVGMNGWGKSFLLRMLALFSKEKLSLGDFLISDDYTGGVGYVNARGFGMEASIQSDGGKPIMTGEPLPINGLPDPINDLVTGGNMIGEEAAFRRRLAALVRWLGIESDENSLQILLNGDKYGIYMSSVGKDGSISTKTDRVTIKEGTDLIDLSMSMRRRLQYLAREKEKSVEVEQSKLDELNGSLKLILSTHGIEREELEELACSVESSRRESDGLHTELVLAKEQRKAGLQALQRDKELIARLGEKPDIGEAQDKAEDTRRVLNSVKKRHIAVVDKVDKIRAMLDAAQEEQRNITHELEQSTRDVEHAEANLSKVRESLNTWDEITKRLSEEQKFPSEETILRIEEEFIENQQSQEKCKAASDGLVITADIDRQRAIIEELTIDVARMRQEAADIWIRLASVVNSEIAAESIRVNEESIEVLVDGKWYDIADNDRVSEGIRFDACYQLMVSRRKNSAVVVEKSTTVDPKHLARLSQMARERGLILILERQPVEFESQEPRVVYYGDEITVSPLGGID